MFPFGSHSLRTFLFIYFFLTFIARIKEFLVKKKENEKSPNCCLGTLYYMHIFFQEET